jgi:hypothetical protein
LSPANEAVVAGSARAVAFEQIAPGRTRFQGSKDAVENASVVHPWNTARLIRKHRSDDAPFRLGALVAYDSWLLLLT